MLRSLILDRFKAFGSRQTIEMAPITLIYGALLFFAYFLYVQDLLPDVYVNEIITYSNLKIIMLCIAKFLMDLTLYRFINRGNSKSITTTIFIVRVVYDLCVMFPVIIYFYYDTRITLLHALIFIVPIGVS